LWHGVSTVKEDPKRVYYLSLEFLMGRSLLNALMNLDLDKPYAEALSELGYKLEVCHLFGLPQPLSGMTTLALLSEHFCEPF
jgi:glucan phosphorylase